MELATVVTIIGMLAAIALPNFLNAQIRAKVARSLSEQELIVWALESYFVDEDMYPLNATVGASQANDLSRLTTPIPYMSQLPRDQFLSPSRYEKNEWMENERNGNPFYFYVNYLQINNERMALAPYSETGSANYTVYGMGPGFTTDINPLEPNQFVGYEPSNGTTSAGMIRTFGP